MNQIKLKEIFDYDPETGIFKWKKTGKGRLPKVGSYSNGYIIIKLEKKTYSLHRLAWLYVYGEFPKNQIHHINHIKDDNRIKNLVDVTPSKNCRMNGLRSDNTSGYKGICRDITEKWWKVTLCINKNKMNIGRFKNIEDAVKARKQAELDYNY